MSKRHIVEIVPSIRDTIDETSDTWDDDEPTKTDHPILPPPKLRLPPPEPRPTSGPPRVDRRKPQTGRRLVIATCVASVLSIGGAAALRMRQSRAAAPHRLRPTKALAAAMATLPDLPPAPGRATPVPAAPRPIRRTPPSQAPRAASASGRGRTATKARPAWAGHLTTRPMHAPAAEPQPTLVVFSSPPQMYVELDGVLIGRTPLVRRLPEARRSARIAVYKQGWTRVEGVARPDASGRLHFHAALEATR